MNKRFIKRLISVFVVTLMLATDVTSSCQNVFAAECTDSYAENMIETENGENVDIVLGEDALTGYSEEDTVNENIVNDEDYSDEYANDYSDEYANEYEDAMSDDETESDDSMFAEGEEDIAADSEYSISGKLYLPEGSFLSGGNLTGTIYIYYKISSGSQTYEYSSITIPEFDNRDLEDDEEPAYISYSVNTSEPVSRIDYFRFVIGSNNKLETNLETGISLYSTEDEWTLDPSNKAGRDISGVESVDYVLPMSKVYGVVSFPDDVYLLEKTGDESLSASVYAYYTQNGRTYSKNCNVELTSSKRKLSYHISGIPREVDCIKYVSVSISNYYPDTNLIYGMQYYDGTRLVTDSTKAVSFDIPEEGAEIDLTLRTTQLKFTVELPDDAVLIGGNLSGYVYVTYKNGSKTETKYYQVYISEESRRTSVYLNNIPCDMDQIESIYLKISNISDNQDYYTNVTTDVNEYYSTGGILRTDSTKAVPVQLTNGINEIVLVPRLVQLKLTVKLPDAAFVTGGKLTGTVGVKYTNGSSNSSKEYNITIPEGSRSVSKYVTGIPCDLEQVNSIYFKFSNINTSSVYFSNLITNNYEYYAEGGVLKTDSAKAVPVTLTSDAKEVVMEARTTKAHFNLKLGDGAYISGGSLSGKITATDNNGKSCSKSFTFPEDESSIDLYINDSVADISTFNYISVKFDDNPNVDTNIVTSVDMYYTGSGWVANKTACDIDVTSRSVVNLTYGMSKVIPVRVKLPANARLANSAITGKVYMQYSYTASGSSKSRTSPEKVFTINPGETYADVTVPVIDTITNITRVTVKVDTPSYAATNIQPGIYYYNNGQLVTSTSSLPSIAYSSVASGLDVPLRTTKTISGTISLPEGSYIYDADLKGGYVTAYTGTEYKGYFTISKDTKTGYYEIPLNDNATAVTRLRIYFGNDDKAVTNIITGSNYYYSSQGLVNNDPNETITLTSDKTTVDFAALKTKSISGKIFMPENAYIEGDGEYLTATVYAYGTYGSFNQKITMTDAGEYEYHIALNNNCESVSKLYVSLSKSNNVRTNLYTGYTMYYAGEQKMSTDSSKCVAIDLSQSEAVQDIELLTIPVLKGKIALDSDAEFSGANLSGTIYAYYTTETGYTSYVSSNFTIPAGERKTAYTLQLPIDAKTVKYAYIYFNSNNNIRSNINLSKRVYYGLSGERSSEYSNIAVTALTDDITLFDFNIPKAKTVSGKIKLGEGAHFTGADIKATVYAYYKSGTNNYEVSSNITLAEGASEVSYSLLMNHDASELSYIKLYLNNNSQIQSNITLGTNVYAGVDGVCKLSSSEITPTELTEDDTNIDIILNRQKTISGKVKIPEQAYFTGGDIEIEISPYVNGTRYSTKAVIAEGETEAAYSVSLPSAASTINYISVSVSTSADTNLYTGSMYWKDNGCLSPNSDNRLSYVLNGIDDTLDIALDYKKVIRGEIIVPDDIYINTRYGNPSSIDAALTFKVDGYEENISIVIDNETKRIPYEYKVPQGCNAVDTVVFKIGYDGDDHDTNILTGTVYYNAVKGKWASTYLDATRFPLSEAVTVFDINVQKAVKISGKISLPENGRYSGSEMRGYVSAYVGDDAYISYFSYSDDCRYSIRLPLGSENISKLQIMVYDNSALNTNILTGTEMYLTADDKWDASELNAVQIPIVDGGVEKDITLPLATIIKGRIKIDSKPDSTLRGTVGAIVSNSEYKSDFTIDETSGEYKIVLPTGFDSKAILYYQLDETDSDKYIVGKVFISPEGEEYDFETSRALAKEITLSEGENNIDLDIRKWEECDTDTLLNSQHPYANDKEYKLEYEFSGTADSMTIHFSRYTNVEEEFDAIEIYNADGSLQGSYSGDELADKEIVTEGNAFKIVLGADSGRNGYGFAIDSISVNNAVPDAIVVAGAVHENDETTGVLITNFASDNRRFNLSSACYSSDGKMIGLKTKRIEVAPGMASTTLEFENYDYASSGKIMLYDESLSPICENSFIIYAHNVVTYDYNYNDMTSTVSLKDGEILTSPAIVPQRLGYKFAGWYTTPECTDGSEATFGEAVNESFTLYAKWNAAYALNTRVIGKGHLVATGVEGITALPGDNISYKAVVDDDNYMFDRWTVSGLTEEDYTVNTSNGTISFTMPEEPVTINAVFTQRVEIIWKSTGAFYDDTELIFNDNNIMYVPEEVEILNLKGEMSEKNNKEITKVSYSYSYYQDNEDGTQSYIETDETDIELNGSEFAINGLIAGFGINTVTIRVVADGKDDIQTFSVIKNKENIDYKDGVDIVSSDDTFSVDFLKSLVAYWEYDNELKDNPLDDGNVFIIRKNSVIGKRLMMKEGEQERISVGDVFVIPPCEEFELGYSFKVYDFGDAECAPEIPEDSEYYGEVFSSEEYLYMIAVSPSLADITDDAISFVSKGVNGIAYSELPENASVECIMEADDGSILSTSFGDPNAVTDGSVSEMQGYINIVPEYSIVSDKIKFKVSFKDIVLYDKDGNKNTVFDQIKMNGSYEINDMSVETAFEKPACSILPKQFGAVVDYTDKTDLKFSIGGTVKNGKEGVELSLSEAVEKLRGGKADNSNYILGKKVEGIDMGSTVVLAAVGFTVPNIASVGAGYNNITDTSRVMGLQPILVAMICLDLDGSVKAEFTYQYTKETYVAKGFNIQDEDYSSKEPYDKIGQLHPTESFNISGYNIDVYNIQAKSRDDFDEPSGVHTFTLAGTAHAEASLCFGIGLVVWGINLATLKGGIYAEATVEGEASLVLEKGKEPVFDADASLTIGVGAKARLDARALLVWEEEDKDKNLDGTKFGLAMEPKEWKWELINWGITTVGISGVITEPSLSVEQEEDNPLSDVYVVLTKKEDPFKIPTKRKSGTEGKYSFRNLTPGTYNLEFTKTGYKTVTKEVKVSTKKVELNVALPLDKYINVTGRILDEDGTTPLKGMKLTIVSRSDSSVTKTVTSDDAGKFAIGNKTTPKSGLAPGVYKVTITGNGRKPVEMYIEVIDAASGELDLGDIVAVDASYGNYTVTGTIKDYATNRATGATLRLKIRRGANNTFGVALKSIKVPASGSYSVQLPAGTYTFSVYDERTGISDSSRYITSHSIITVGKKNNTGIDLYVGQASSKDQIRIILRWGETPRDLDSHLVGPTGDGSSRFHTAFYNKSYYYGNNKYADLDVDVVTSYGPETTTIYYKNGSGRYSFYVHDYTNGGSTTSTAMSNSGATVQVYVGSTIVKTYYVPKNRVATIWHVFDYDAGSGTFTDGGEMTCGSTNDLASEEEGSSDIDMILSDIALNGKK